MSNFSFLQKFHKVLYLLLPIFAKKKIDFFKMVFLLVLLPYNLQLIV
jgi:hypothetical protein